MTAAIKRMLKERADLAAPKSKPYDPFDRLFQMIEKAAPFIDGKTKPNEWKQSELMKLSFCIMATGETGPKAAAETLLRNLDAWRVKWLAGEC